MNAASICQEFDAEYIKLRERKEMYERRAAKLEKKMPSWLDTIDRLVAEVVKALGVEGVTVERMGPFGICSRVPVYIEDPAGNVIWHVDFEVSFGQGVFSGYLGPSEGRTDTQLFVRDYSVSTRKFSPGTLGEMNGMNHPLININDWTVEKLVEWGRPEEPWNRHEPSKEYRQIHPE